LAKIQEAKEIPVVSVLDAASIPEKKSFPPRMAMIVLGGFLSLAGGITWILGNDAWQKIDPEHPGKLLLQEIISQVTVNVSPKSVRADLYARLKSWRSATGTSPDHTNGNLPSK